MDSLRHQIWRQLDIEARPGHTMSLVNRALVVAILVSVAAVVLETEPTIRSGAPVLFISLEQFFGWLFVTEYLARLWSAGERKEYSGLTGRLKYAATPVALIDLLAVTPFLLAPFIDSMDGTAFYVLRLMRLFRVLTLARTGPFTTAARQIWHGIVDRRYELAFSSLVAFAMMIVAATLLYVAERDVQPEAFGSIPRAMWWAIATLTTVGYGDVYPATILGKILAGLVALSGIGLVAMPAGILASALSTAYQERKARRGRDEAAAGPAPESERHQSEGHQRGMD
ncbi:ion transporter [uncultured Nisaea sp.]|uniref:ion transporter n=1 Tax=uncultured Nisaea sp. TaxID=538215 RepID=UPI0030EB79F7